MAGQIIKGISFAIAAAGVLLWLSGYTTIGIGLVIGGYIIYVLVRIIPKLTGITAGTKETPKFTFKEKAIRNQPDSWDTLRKKALEALDRKIRGHKLDINSFFGKAYDKYPALVKVKSHMSDSSDELILKTDYEILKLQLSPQATLQALENLSSEIKSEEELDQEIKRLRIETQP